MYRLWAWSDGRWRDAGAFSTKAEAAAFAADSGLPPADCRVVKKNSSVDFFLQDNPTRRPETAKE